MSTSMGCFRLYDTYQKQLLKGDYAFLSHDEIAELNVDKNSVCLESIGRRDRYILVPELPHKDNQGRQLWVGDILTNQIYQWVIRYDFLTGVYASLLDMPSSRYVLDEVVSAEGMFWLGDIFDGVTLIQSKSHRAVINTDPMLFL